MSYDKCCCSDYSYQKADRLLKNELAISIRLSDVLKEKAKHLVFPLDIEQEFYDESDLTLHERLKPFSDSVGVYLIWLITDICDEHNTYKLYCVYAGKGGVPARIKCHVKKKFENRGKLIVSIFECKNRLAKYLEQLILDCYSLALNTDENQGEDELFMQVNKDRIWQGGTADEQAYAYAAKND